MCQLVDITYHRGCAGWRCSAMRERLKSLNNPPQTEAYIPLIAIATAVPPPPQTGGGLLLYHNLDSPPQ